VLIGLEILVLTFTKQYLLLSVLIIPVVLVSRFISIGIPLSVLRIFRSFTPGAVRILTWGGLRGGISVALALSIAQSEERSMILAFTYTVVLFSVIVQGSTIKQLVKKVVGEAVVY
jgi:CPA1 family monovalent cation:H+ antiporter